MYVDGERERTWRLFSLMYAQMSLRAWVRGISGTPTTACITGETGRGFIIPLGSLFVVVYVFLEAATTTVHMFTTHLPTPLTGNPDLKTTIFAAFSTNDVDNVPAYNMAMFCLFESGTEHEHEHEQEQERSVSVACVDKLCKKWGFQFQDAPFGLVFCFSRGYIYKPIRCCYSIGPA